MNERELIAMENAGSASEVFALTDEQNVGLGEDEPIAQGLEVRELRDLRRHP